MASPEYTARLQAERRNARRRIRPAGPPRECRGCHSTVPGWGYCRRCQKRLQVGEPLPDADGLTRDDMAALRRMWQPRLK